MSKYPTSCFSPRERACIEYGKLIFEFESEFGEGGMCNPPLWDGDSRYMKHLMLKDLRAARERIFRCCLECRHCDVEAGYCLAYGLDGMNELRDYDEACFCERYEERRGDE